MRGRSGVLPVVLSPGMGVEPLPELWAPGAPPVPPLYPPVPPGAVMDAGAAPVIN